MFGGKIGAPEIILILVVVIMLFGAKKLPDMARSLGRSARILKSEAKAMKKEGGSEEDDSAASTSASPAEPQHEAPKTIKASPGDAASSRPVSDPAEQKAQS